MVQISGLLLICIIAPSKLLKVKYYMFSLALSEIRPKIDTLDLLCFTTHTKSDGVNKMNYVVAMNMDHDVIYKCV